MQKAAPGFSTAIDCVLALAATVALQGIVQLKFFKARCQSSSMSGEHTNWLSEVMQKREQEQHATKHPVRCAALVALTRHDEIAQFRPYSALG